MLDSLQATALMHFGAPSSWPETAGDLAGRVRVWRLARECLGLAGSARPRRSLSCSAVYASWGSFHGRDDSPREPRAGTNTQRGLVYASAFALDDGELAK